MTGFGSPEIRREALERGAADYWEKSLPVREVVSRLRELGAG
jgi:DNA-binding response OmpR family regulator